MASWLVVLGFDVAVMTDFVSARNELDTRPPHLLVAELKLQAFNGLHLVSRLRRRSPNTPAIVIGESDVVLEADARQFGARYLKHPLDQEMLVATAKTLMEQADSVEVQPAVPGLNDLVLFNENVRTLSPGTRGGRPPTDSKEVATIVQFRPGGWRHPSN